MRSFRLSRLDILFIVPPALFLLSAQIAMTQSKPSATDAPSQLSSLAAQSRAGSRLPLTKNNALPNLWQLAKTNEQQIKARHVVGNALAEWLTRVMPPDTGSYRALDKNEAVQYYGHRIPWAGQIILGLGKQAQFHPRVARIFEVIKPGVSFDKPRHPWTRR